MSNVETWRREGDLIVLPPVVSDGASGAQWTERFVTRRDARNVLLSQHFAPSPVGTLYRPVILPGACISHWHDRSTRSVREAGSSRGLAEPHAEVSCIVREALTDEALDAMQLRRVVVMHAPIAYGGGPRLLCCEYGDAVPHIRVCHGNARVKWRDDDGFMFVLS